MGGQNGEKKMVQRKSVGKQIVNVESIHPLGRNGAQTISMSFLTVMDKTCIGICFQKQKG